MFQQTPTEFHGVTEAGEIWRRGRLPEDLLLQRDLRKPIKDLLRQRLHVEPALVLPQLCFGPGCQGFLNFVEFAVASKASTLKIIVV